MQQKDKIAEGSRLPSPFLEAPFFIIEGRLGDFKKGLIPKTNKQTNRLLLKNNILALRY